MKNIMSRYSAHYPRTLIYMLQATEYAARDYVAWYRRTRDFSRVEHRKRFVATAKSLSLLIIAWAFIALFLGGAIIALAIIPRPFNYIVSLLIIILMPYVLAYAILAPLWVMWVTIQRPVEIWIMRRTRRKLEAQRAVKIGIAGSFGKTTMREILKAVLSQEKKVAAPPHSWNTPLGISRFVDTLAGDEDILIFEFGEYYPRDVKKLCDLTGPAIGIITGVNEAHLEKFQSLERTARTIYELADYLGTKPIYVNGESKRARDRARAGHIVYSRESVGDWKIEDQKTGLTGTSFTLVRDDAKLEFTSRLLGLHQIGPLAAAAIIARELGLSWDSVRRGVAATAPFNHRVEPRTDSAGVVMIDDTYNGNPDGVRAAIDFLASLRDRRRWYMTPGLVEMGSRTSETHKEIGRHLAQAGIEKIILVKNSVTSFIEAGLKEENYQGDIIWFDDALAAFAALPHLTATGDVVLLQNDWPDQYQ